MFNFDEPRYEKVVSDALALRPQIEAAVDKVWIASKMLV